MFIYYAVLPKTNIAFSKYQEIEGFDKKIVENLFLYLKKKKKNISKCVT